MVGAALQSINSDIGFHLYNSSYHRAECRPLSEPFYCPNRVTSPSILNLFDESPVRLIMDDFLGANTYDRAVFPQIALKFPNSSTVDLHTQHLWDNGHLPGSQGAWHIDGFRAAAFGLCRDEIAHFTGIVGIFLSDVQVPHGGNLRIFPGSHNILAGYFSQHNAWDLLGRHFPRLHFSPSSALLVHAGDVVVFHSLTAHSASLNFSPSIRYAVYFRCASRLRPPYSYVAHLLTKQHMWDEWTMIDVQDIHNN